MNKFKRDLLYPDSSTRSRANHVKSYLVISSPAEGHENVLYTALLTT